MKTSLISLLLIPLLIVGCGRSAPTNFYLLDAEHSKHRHLEQLSQHANIGIGPITIAKYLDKPEIVTRDSQHKLTYDDFNHWAEPLDDNIESVMVDNLTYQLPTFQLFRYPWRTRTKIIAQIKIEILRFDTEPDGDSILKAKWYIYNSDKQRIYSKISTYHTRTKVHNDYQAIAAAMSQNLQQLSHDIAKKMSQQKHGV